MNKTTKKSTKRKAVKKEAFLSVAIDFPGMTLEQAARLYNTLDTFKRMSNDGTLLYIDNIEPRRLTTNESLQIKITNLYIAILLLS